MAGWADDEQEAWGCRKTMIVDVAVVLVLALLIGLVGWLLYGLVGARLFQTGSTGS